MHTWAALPERSLQPAGPLTTESLARGIVDVRALGRYLQALPFGRPLQRANFSAVLREGRGTCSTKHAFLAAVAAEQGLDVVLTLGIYDMHAGNTPGVGAVLRRHGLPCLPEAHCYLTYAGMRIDITRLGTDSAEPIARFLYEEFIAPEQIGDYKLRLHQRYMRDWVRSNGAIVGGRGCDDVWEIREECIAALAS